MDRHGIRICVAADVPLYGLETRHALSDFDVIGFSLPYEQLPPRPQMSTWPTCHCAAAHRSADIHSSSPGSGYYNPEPMSAFFDGEGEEVLIYLV